MDGERKLQIKIHRLMTTKIFKFDLTMAGHSCHCLLSPFTGIGLLRDVPIMVTNLQNLLFFIRHY